jgi:hypothetical protein
VSRLSTLLFLAGLAGVALGGCFDRPTPACAFLCGDDGACPDGYRCAADQWCKRDDVADGFECGPAPADAAPDAPPATPVDAAPPDAPADAAPDGPDDAAPDAMPTDASAPDAIAAGLR